MTQHVPKIVLNKTATVTGPLPATQQLNLAITLPWRNQSQLDQLLKDLYNPQSPSYHKYLSAAEFTNRFGPSQSDYQSLVNFVETHGLTVTGTSPDNSLIDVSGSTTAIKSAFHVNLGLYTDPSNNRAFYAPDREPAVDLNIPMWHVGGLDNYAVPHPAIVMGSNSSGGVVNAAIGGSGPGGYFLGSDRRAAYANGTSLTGTGQTVALLEFGGYSVSDLTSYYTNTGQTLNVPINNVLLDNASAASDGDDTEQIIDIIEAASMAPDLSQILVYIAPYSSFTAGVQDTDIFKRMATDDIAKQISVSWLWDPVSTNPLYNDAIFQQLAAQGQSLFAASGDWGSYPSYKRVYYPAEDAWVTAVGGTELTTNGAGGSWLSETAWGTSTTSCPINPYTYSSGGGISQDGIAIPSYQQISGVINTANQGSTTLRNVPDVAAEANCDNYYCSNGSCLGDPGVQPLGGTSLAAPTWAGYMALLNQQAVANSQSPLGFINSEIYSTGGGAGYTIALNNVSGDSNGTYTAVAGYNLVTGWGSPSGIPAPVLTLTAGQCESLGRHGISYGATVSMTDSASGAQIYFTTDGTTPTTSSTLYPLSYPLHPQTTTTYEAIAAVGSNVSSTSVLTVTPSSSWCTPVLF